MFGIKPPWYQNPVEQTAFNAYAHHQQKIEDFINALATADDPNDWLAQSRAASSADLDMSSLTYQEREYIESEVAKRWQS